MVKFTNHRFKKKQFFPDMDKNLGQQKIANKYESQFSSEANQNLHFKRLHIDNDKTNKDIMAGNFQN